MVESNAEAEDAGISFLFFRCHNPPLIFIISPVFSLFLFDYGSSTGAKPETMDSEEVIERRRLLEMWREWRLERRYYGGSFFYFKKINFKWIVNRLGFYFFKL